MKRVIKASTDIDGVFSLIGNVYANDGEDLPHALAPYIKRSTFKHVGNFEFTAVDKNGQRLWIITKPDDPNDDDYKYIRIEDIA